VVRLVGRFPGIAAGRLAALLHLHPSTLTGILVRLDQQGLIERRRDPRDRRRWLLGLTAKGRRVDVESRGTVEAAVHSVLAKTPPSRVKQVAGVLRELAAALQARSQRAR
jgi:DNA-binding MarR family transcriptional regulator